MLNGLTLMHQGASGKLHRKWVTTQTARRSCAGASTSGTHRENDQ